MTSKHSKRDALTTADILKAAGAPGAFGASAYAVPKILATLYKVGVGAREVAEVIGQEPGMTASVLRVANSSLYGQSRAVSTVDRAVVLLGLDTVRGISAAACMRNTILRVDASSPIDVSAMLLHGVATAVAAAALSRIHRPTLAPGAFVAGLLHDLGVTVQVRLNPEGVSELIEAMRLDPTNDSSALEEERVGVSHARCAAVIFEAWKLPATIVAATGHHHDPATAPESHRTLAALVNLGNHLSLACGMVYPCEPAPAARSAEAMALLGLSDEDIESVSATLPEQVAEVQRALAGP